ncbi:MAG: PAS domain S-box protein [Anaerolineales bacterium]|nr:PAS domain S-box protein [Anaerolineales bacterium]
MLYALFGAVWIITTDKLVEWIFTSEEALITAQTIKGILFIVVTTGVVYWLAVRIVDSVRFEQIEAELDKSQQFAQSLLANMTEGFQIIDHDWRYVYINAAAVKHARFPREELLGRTMMDAYPGIEDTEMFAALQDSMQNRVHHGFENEFTYPDGQSKVFFLSIYPTSEGVCIVSVDITEIKNVETALRESEERFRSLVDATSLVVWSTDAEGRTVTEVPTWQAFTGQSKEDILGYGWMDALHADDREHVQKEWQRAVEQHSTYEGEFRVRRHDGEYRYMFSQGVPIVNADGSVREWIGTNADITKRKLAEAALRSNEERYRLLAENTLDLIWTMDMELTTTYVNPAVEQILGYTPDEFVGTHLSMQCSEAEYSKILEVLDQESKKGFPDEGVVLETELFRKDGSLVPVEIHGRVIFDEASIPAGLQGTTRDITERRQAEHRQQKLLQQVTSLGRIDQLIISLAPMEVALQQVVQETLNNIDADAAAILILTEPHHKLNPVARLGFSGKRLFMKELHLDEGFAGRAAVQRQTLTYPDIQVENIGFTRIEMARVEGFHGYACSPMLAKGNIVGVLEVFRRAVGPPPAEQIEFLKTLAGQAAMVVDTLATFKDLQISNEKLYLAYDASIEGWSRALDYRDKETEGHSRRVTEITIALAQAMGIPDDRLHYIRWGSLLHDIGKMGVPDRILLKSGQLTAEEWEIMRRHPTIARDLLTPIVFLQPAIDIPYCHHERWDGDGYPRGLADIDIPLAARIFAVADVWDAMRSERPYRERWPEEKVLQHLREISGSQLDPQVVEKFLEVIHDIPTCNASNYEQE